MSEGIYKISCKPKEKTIVKFGFGFQGIVIFLGCIAMLFFTYEILSDKAYVFSFIFFGVTIFFFYVGKRYLDNFYFKEYILLETGKIIVVHKTLFNKKQHEFDLKDIVYFGFAGRIDYTEHPMKNDVIDFTGLATVEKELQYLIDEGTMEIRTNEKTLRFGKNLASWDVEEIVSEIEGYYTIKFDPANQNNFSSDDEEGTG